MNQVYNYLLNSWRRTLARNAENGNNHLPESPDPREADPTHHEWFRNLELELLDAGAVRVERLRESPIHDRQGADTKCSEDEVRRIERDKWKLPEAPT
jgi:hypothetical protein